VKPRNTVALVGDRVILSCATNTSSGQDIRWVFITDNLACRPALDRCDLVIESVRTGDAGGYECSDRDHNVAQASLIVIGKLYNVLLIEASLFLANSNTSSNYNLKTVIFKISYYHCTFF